MPTRPIGPGTRNLSINAPAAMAQALGRLAVLEGYRSYGALVRELCAQRIAAARARGLELARDSRQLILPLSFCLLIAAGFLSTALAALLGTAEPRRPIPGRCAITTRTLILRARREGACDT